MTRNVKKVISALAALSMAFTAVSVLPADKETEKVLAIEGVEPLFEAECEDLTLNGAEVATKVYNDEYIYMIRTVNNSAKRYILLSLDDFYKTDTHWKQENIVDVAQVLCNGMGTSSTQQYTEKTLDKEFYGVYYGQSALPLESETIKYLTNEAIENCVVYDYQNGKETSVYDLEKGMGKDPYELFLSGPISLISIENKNAKTDKELIIFRDSFGSSIAPLLIDGYKKITLVDIRYIHPNFLGQYIEFNNQDVLFLYSTSVLNNSETIK